MQETRALVLVLLVAAAPSAPRAEEPEAPPGRFDFDLDWDRGVTYRWEQRLGDLDPTGIVPDTVLTGRIGGSLWLDGGFTTGDALSNEGWRGKVRRVELETSGRLEGHLTTEYAFDFAVEGNRFYLDDFSLSWRLPRFADRLCVGYFDPPLAFQDLASGDSLTLIETAAPVSAFVPSSVLAIQLAGYAPDPSLSWFLQLSSFGQRQESGDASRQPLRFGGRLVWRPWGGVPADAPLLHLGASLAYSPPGTGSEVRHRARPESFLVDYAVDTGDVDGGDTLVGVEAVWRRGAYTAQGEVFTSTLYDTDVGDPTFWGAYLQTSVVLTGETHAYHAENAEFERIQPRSPFGWGRHGSGALELAARLSWLDLSEKEVEGGRLLTLSFGPAWTWNRNVRVLSGFVLGDVGGRPDDGPFGIYQMRLELSF
jgi:phosphate-selective porin OprO/OprP